MNKDLFTETIMQLLEDAGVETGQGSERGLLTETAVNDIADAIFPFVAQRLAAAWDEGRNSFGADFLKRLDTFGTPPQTVNPYRASEKENV